MFAAMSDVVEAKYRTPGYGMLMAVFFGSFSIAPAIAVGFQDPIHVAVFSLFFIFASFLYATFFLPETLRSHHLRRHNDLSSDATVRQPVVAHGDSGPALGFCDTVCQWSVWLSAKITRPVRDAAIINRDWTIRQIAIGSFFSSMVHASDVTLIVYYIEDHLNVHQKDIASLFLVLGLAGIVIQAGLEPLIRLLGEKGLLITAFCCGTLHNFLYGIAQSKSTIYIAFIVSQVTKTNMPILSSMASKHVSPNEQGRVQGALFATNAIASAIGPMVLVYFYHLTKDKHPGAMFLCASGLYSIGTIVVSLTNVKEIEDDSVSDSTSGADRRQSNINDNEYICPATSLEQPLLSSE